LVHAQATGTTIEQRKAFPDLKIPFVEKKEDFATSSFKGKVTVLFFWATWCQFCKARMPALPQIEAAFGKGQVQTLLLNVDSDLELAKKYLLENPKVGSSLFDRDLRIKKMASVRAIPYSLVIDQHGVVRFIQEGDRANEISILLRKVQKLVPKGGPT
jgi:cytochrome c biogenesis protein CcmG/thiol:disulfide interchange protein DsbE